MPARTRVLFVDDEPLVLQGLQRLLRNMRAEWEMVFVDSAPMALEALARTPFEVVVADMCMPGMNGAEFINRVKELYPATIRLVLSGHADPELVLGVEGAAHQFLSKPCDPELLRTVILAASDIGGRLRSEEIRRVLGGIAHLPVIPATYHEILGLLALESTNVEDLGAVVKRDPGMTANILKIVNSAYFGLRQQVSDPAQAIAYLGVDTLKSLALLHGIFEQVHGFPPGFSAAHLWRHSLDTAAACREIARIEGLDRSVQSQAFTGGLIHDVGLLILASGLPEAYGQVARILVEEPVEIVAAEVRVLGVHHGEVGAHLLGLWGLPEAIVEAVAHHHSLPIRTGTTPALIVHAAEMLSAGQGDGRLFGVHRPGDLQFLSALLGPRLERWQGALEGVQDAGGDDVNTKVLFVDDDDNVLAAAHRNFRKRYQLDTASGGPQALRAMEEHGPYAVVVADMAMPGMNGIEFLKCAQILAPDTIRIMFTGHPGPVTLMEAINSGQVFRFLAKPCPPEDMMLAVDAGVRQHRMVTAEKELLETTLTRSVEAMTGMFEVLDPPTFTLARNLAERAAKVARGLGGGDVWPITLAALFSPLWILALPSRTRGRLTSGRLQEPRDPAQVAEAVRKAAKLVQPIPRLEAVANILRGLGEGYDPALDLPPGSAPEGSRILRALLDLGAIEGRVHSLEVALEELRLRGPRYEPRILACIASTFDVPLHDH